ncbi:hypothetical protein Bca4012_009219 [Brassica carinata]
MAYCYSSLKAELAALGSSFVTRIQGKPGLSNPLSIFATGGTIHMLSGTRRAADRAATASTNWRVEHYHRGLSLKGNTYWFATKKRSDKSDGDRSFLVCFDFTREIFGPPLPMPFEPFDEDTMEIWVTTKIDPENVSWNTKVFLEVDMRSLTRFDFQFLLTAVTFFIDEEKKVAVVFDKNNERPIVDRSPQRSLHRWSGWILERSRSRRF